MTDWNSRSGSVSGFVEMKIVRIPFKIHWHSSDLRVANQLPGGGGGFKIMSGNPEKGICAKKTIGKSTAPF